MSESFVIPIESNPDVSIFIIFFLDRPHPSVIFNFKLFLEVLNKFMIQVGVSEAFQLVDVYGLDEAMLAMIPKPVYALVLLFPCSENDEKFRRMEDEKLKQNQPEVPEKLFYMRQYLHNACGTIALFHAILNNLQHIDVKEGPLKSFYEKAKGLTPEERGKLLEQDKGIIEIHQSLAREGQTAAPPEDEKVLFHFTALTNFNGELFELDGRKNFPISHGKTSDDSFVADAAAVCKEFMARDEKELRFTVMAIAAAGEN